MRALLWTVILAFAGWSGWWWFASSTAKSAAEEAFVEARAQGWAAGHGGISVAGYPNRVDLTLTRPELAEPEGRWGWSAPFLQLFALSYRPWHLIAAFAPEQQLLTPAGPVTLSAAKLQGSLVLTPNTDLTLDRSQIVGEALVIKAPFGDLGLRSLSLASRIAAEGAAEAPLAAPLAATGTLHDLGLDLQGIALPEALQAQLPADLFAPGQARLHIEARAAFDAPLDRHAGASRPGLTAVDLRDAYLDWGASRLSLNGRIAPDGQGYAEGTLTLQVAGAPEILRAAQTMGLISTESLRRIELIVAAGGGAEGQPITLPLALRDGQIRLGPFPLAPAPRLR